MPTFLLKSITKRWVSMMNDMEQGTGLERKLTPVLCTLQ